MHGPMQVRDEEDRAARLIEREALQARLAAIDAQLGADAAEMAGAMAVPWQAILDALPAHVALLDARGHIVQVNRAWREFAAANAFHGDDFGVEQDYLAVCANATGECADEADAAQRGIREVLEGQRPEFALEYPCHSPDQLRWFRMEATPIRPGGAHGCVVMHVDVTERRLAEESLRRSEERYRLVARATANAIWDWDVATGEVEWSGRLDSLFGYHPRDVRADRDFWSNHVHQEDLPRTQASLDAVLAGGHETWECEYRFRRRDGSYAIVVDRGFVVRDAQGRPLRMVGGMSDLTDVRTLEAQLRASQRLEAVGQLTGGIAHDFNNLLTVVLGNAELLGERLPAGTLEHELAAMVLAAAQRGSDLTQRLLAFARRQALELRLVELGELVRGMQHLVRGALGDPIDLELDLASGCWVMADVVQLENAVLNLCINARDAMPGHGRLEIAVSRQRLAPRDIDPLARAGRGHYVRLEIRDTGHGIPDEVLPKVIEPFFTTKATGKGTGLGLSMVYGLIKQSSGYLDIRSQPGRGTVVSIHLPLADPPASLGAPEGTAARQREGGSEHVLLVEDDALVRRYTANQLRALGYRVSAATDGNDALAMLQRDPGIDLLMTDVMMPGMNGPQLAEAARRLRPGLPVLYSSGYSEDVLASEGRLPPGVLLLAKPYQQAELARRLRQALA